MSKIKLGGNDYVFALDETTDAISKFMEWLYLQGIHPNKADDMVSILISSLRYDEEHSSEIWKDKNNG